MPLRSAIQASTHSASSERRRSSAQSRRFDSRRTRCTHASPCARVTTPYTARAAAATSAPPITACEARLGCSTSGSAMTAAASAMPTWASSTAASSRCCSRRSMSRGPTIAADPLPRRST